MFEIFAKNGLLDVILGSEGKTSDLAAYYSRNYDAAYPALFLLFQQFKVKPIQSRLHCICVLCLTRQQFVCCLFVRVLGRVDSEVNLRP